MKGRTMTIKQKYDQYRNVRLQAQREYLSYDLWKQEYATDVDLQSSAINEREKE